jgi:hypothetical protein
LLTLLVELDAVLNRSKKELNPALVGQRLDRFYNEVDALFKQADNQRLAPRGAAGVAKYLKAATKATNDKYARDARAGVVSRVILAPSAHGKKGPLSRAR